MLYIFKNAFKSITRSPGRNIIVGFIVIVVAISSCISLSIKGAAADAQKTGMEALTITAQISVDRQAMMQQASEAGEDMREVMRNASELSLEELNQYAQAQSVSNFYYTLTTSLNGSDNLEPVDTTQNTNNNQPPMFGGDGPRGGMGVQGDFTLIGYSSYAAMTGFIDGTIKITQGKVFDENAETARCVISEDLAELNNLEIGNSITLSNPNKEEETYTLTIVGIYNDSSGNTSGQMMFSAANDPANRILISSVALQTFLNQSDASADSSVDEETGILVSDGLRATVSGTFVLKDVNAYESFQNEVAVLGLSSYYRVTSSDVTAFENSMVPLQNLSTFASYSVLIVLLIGGIILIAFNIFNIRERKYEVGVLTAIGMKKSKVALQFITELFTVTLVAIFLGTIVGAVVSVPVANKLLESQVSSIQTQNEQVRDNFGRPDAPDFERPGNTSPGQFKGVETAVDYVQSIDAVVDTAIIGQLLLIGIFLTILSSSAAVLFILRYEPLKILTDRS